MTPVLSVGTADSALGGRRLVSLVSLDQIMAVVEVNHLISSPPVDERDEQRKCVTVPVLCF